jgi:hypothetical protein
MTTAQKLTEEQIAAINSELDNLDEQVDLAQVSVEDARTQAEGYIKAFEIGYIAHEATQLRKDTRKKVSKFLNNLGNQEFQQRREAGLKFEANARLDIDAKDAVRTVGILISKMTANGQNKVKPADVKYLSDKEQARYNSYDDKTRFFISDEQRVQAEIHKLNDYGTYISTEHPAIKDLRQRYDSKTFENYSNLVINPDVNPARLPGILSKMKQAKDAGRYSHMDMNEVQATLNLFASRIPKAS